ncbi:BppU family phage baseplate upper protein [Collinsella aerofaciens]|uniref:BppU family phage baseplate upper protein n=1 Tax=Collinsella aerofaciens TaxID=74426 RepID=UPI003D7BA3B9
MNNQTIELDIDKRGCGNNCIRIAQGENGGTTIKALVFDNGGEFALAGYTAYLVARLPDRIHYYKGTATVSGNTVTHVCEESKLACVPGYTDEAYFEFTNGSHSVQTERFALDIMRDAREGNTPAKSWDNAVEALEKRAETAVTKGEQAVIDAGKALNNANTAVNICKSATDAANTATSKANAATKSATDAASAANTAKANADTATNAANTATSAANASKDGADLAAADARKAAEEARGAVSSDMKIYFKRVTDAQGNSWPVLVDMTI